MGQIVPDLNAGQSRTEPLGSGRKNWPGRCGQGTWCGSPSFLPPFPPEDPQAESSISLLPHLEAKIRQTHSLARLLTRYAEQLLQEYVSGMRAVVPGVADGEAQIMKSLSHIFSNSQLWKSSLLKGTVTCSWLYSKLEEDPNDKKRKLE